MTPRVLHQGQLVPGGLILIRLPNNFSTSLRDRLLADVLVLMRDRWGDFLNSRSAHEHMHNSGVMNFHGSSLIPQIPRSGLAALASSKTNEQAETSYSYRSLRHFCGDRSVPEVERM